MRMHGPTLHSTRGFWYRQTAAGVYVFRSIKSCVMGPWDRFYPRSFFGLVHVFLFRFEVHAHPTRSVKVLL